MAFIISIFLVLGLIFVYRIFSFAIQADHDEQEPKVYQPPIPVLSHLLGLIQHGIKYLELLARTVGDSFPEGIFTVKLFGHRSYIITDPSLIVAAQNKSRYLNGNDLFVYYSTKVVGHDKPTIEAYFRDMNNRKVESLSSEIHKGQYAFLGPGSSFNQLRADYNTRITDFQAELFQKTENTSAILNLYQWICRSTLISSAEMAWGKKNPFNEDPELWAAFWSFQEEASTILFNPIASLIARKGIRSRDKITERFIAYFKDSSSKPSPLVDSVLQAFLKYKCTIEANATHQNGLLIASVSNTAPAIYATFAYIYNDPVLVADIRTELDALVARDDSGHASVDLDSLRSRCPLFTSTIYEVLRHISFATAVRKVMEDCTLSIPASAGTREYLLKKNANVILAGAVAHRNPLYWSNPDEFQARRFMGFSSPETQVPGMFRAFGGGSHLCAGRSLVVAEILSTVGGCLVRFDMEAVDTEGQLNGKWILPRQEDAMPHETVAKPMKEPIITVRRRKGWENVVWA